MSFKTVGRLNSKVIKLCNLSIKESNIFLHKSRKKHMRKHSHEFANFEDTYKRIDQIISEPDYVGVHPTGQSVEYIKKIDGNVLVAVRLNSDELTVRTMYVITETKLKNYLNSGRIQKYSIE